MTQGLQIGKKARDLDKESITSRMKLDREVFTKIFLALIFYFSVMGFMSLVL